MPRVSFYTLGCKLNFAESSTIGRDFTERGFDIVPFGTPTDVTVINTCTVTDEADRKCRQVIRRAVKASPGAFIAVTGCYAQLRPEAIAQIPGVDVVLGTHEKFRLFDLVHSFSKREQTQIEVSCIDQEGSFGPAFSTGERTRAFLKVQDGCDYSCSFCTIPLARGRSRSQSVEETVHQAREIATRGFHEIVLSGVNIGLFGTEHGSTLLDLLRELDKVDGIDRYRISSIEPNLLTDEIIDFVAGSRAFQPHFHIPLQSGDDYVLARMRRRYRREVYENRVAHIKRVMPHACIGADVIVGFPAEDETRFQNTARFLADLPVSYIHAFTYSERAQTVAVEQIEKLGGRPVPHAERAQRNRQLQVLSAHKRQAFFKEHQGEVRPVLWEAQDKDGHQYGFTDNYVKLRRTYDPERVGRIEPVRLGTFANDGALEAEDAAFVSVL